MSELHKYILDDYMAVYQASEADGVISRLSATIETQRELLVLAAMNLENYRVLVNLNINADISSQVKTYKRIRAHLNENKTNTEDD